MNVTDDTLVAWYSGGETYADIAERLDVRWWEVERKLNELGVESMPPSERRGETPPQYDTEPFYRWPADRKLKQWVEGGLTLSEMAARISGPDGSHPSPSRVGDILADRGLRTNLGLYFKILEDKDREFLKCTRWAVGKNIGDFVRFLKVSAHTYGKWENGRAKGVWRGHASDWDVVVEMGCRRGVNPEDPAPVLELKAFKRLLGDLMAHFGDTGRELSRRMGFNRAQIWAWVTKGTHPTPESHKAVRDFAEYQGLWKPPSPIEVSRGGRDSPAMSEQDRNLIRELAESKKPAEIANMFGADLSDIFEILRGPCQQPGEKPSQ